MIGPSDLSGAGIEAFPKQFILSETAPKVAGAKLAAFGGWTLAVAPHVPLCPLLAGGRQVGLLAGWVTHAGALVTADAPLEIGSAGAMEIRRKSGRYVFLWAGEGGLEFHLDTAGLLPAVYDPVARVVAATPALLSTERPIVRDAATWAIFDFPRNRGFFPFGLTAWQGISRLLPNHVISLADFGVRRVWPVPGVPLVDTEADAAAAVGRAAAQVQANVEAILTRGVPALYLSGGCDSRMVLAAAARMRERLVTETVAGPDAVDSFIAARVSALAGVPHKLLQPVPASEAEVTGWMDRTGWSIYENVTHHVATMKRHDRGFFAMTGTCAEILRASNWAAEDLGRADLPMEVLLARLRMPPAPAIVAAAEAWMAALPPMRRTAALDVAKIEVIHGCWAAPSIYGHDIIWPSLHPMADGLVYDIAMGLDEAYKMENRAYADFVGALWPELLAIPANKVTGLDRLRFPKKELKKLIPTKVKRMIKPYR
jgi:hypothetical protein